MQSQRKMLSSGTAASRRSVSVRSAGAVGAVATVSAVSVCRSAQDDSGVEVAVAPDEPAWYLGPGAGVDDDSELFARRVRNRHEHRVGSCTPDDALDVTGAAEHRHALQAPPRERGVVVHE